MSTATLTPLPAPRPGAFLAAHHDDRPCVTNPVGWWDTGNQNNGRAITLCRTACPRIDSCQPTKDELNPMGVIRAGDAYDDRGRVQRLCRTCLHPLNKENKGGICDNCHRPKLATHHELIRDMRNAGNSWPAIGRAIGYSSDAVRRYWERQQAVTR